MAKEADHRLRCFPSIHVTKEATMRLSEAISKYILDCKARDLSTATVRWYKRRLFRMARFLNGREISQVDQVTTDDLRSFVVELRDRKTRWKDHPYHPSSNSGLSPYTIHGYVRIMRTYFQWLVDEGITDTNPASGLGFLICPRNHRRQSIQMIETVC